VISKNGEKPPCFLLIFLTNLEYIYNGDMNFVIKRKSLSQFGIILLAIAVVAVLFLNILTLFVLF
jgi:hypothetical protein